jgi:hypothetical protein
MNSRLGKKAGGYTLPQLATFAKPVSGRKRAVIIPCKLCVVIPHPLGKGTRCASPLHPPGWGRSRKQSRTDSQRAHLCKLCLRAPRGRGGNAGRARVSGQTAIACPGAGRGRSSPSGSEARAIARAKGAQMQNAGTGFALGLRPSRISPPSCDPSQRPEEGAQLWGHVRRCALLRRASRCNHLAIPGLPYG